MVEAPEHLAGMLGPQRVRMLLEDEQSPKMVLSIGSRAVAALTSGKAEGLHWGPVLYRLLEQQCVKQREVAWGIAQLVVQSTEARYIGHAHTTGRFCQEIELLEEEWSWVHKQAKSQSNGRNLPISSPWRKGYFARLDKLIEQRNYNESSLWMDKILDLEKEVEKAMESRWNGLDSLTARLYKRETLEEVGHLLLHLEENKKRERLVSVLEKRAERLEQGDAKEKRGHA